MTVENLTSFHRLEREHIFYLFLSGYHTRTKQALLQRIAEKIRDFPGIILAISIQTVWRSRGI